MKQWNNVFKKHGKVFNEIHEDIPKIIQLFKEWHVKKVLDLGSGTGRHVAYLAKNDFDVFGIDIAEEGIRITKDWLRKEKLHADLKIGSIYEKLPYPDGFFDAVISTSVIHHERIENIRKAILELERVLKPEGIIFITVRKRGIKNWDNGKIVEHYGKQSVNYKVIAPRTYVPMDGGEKNLAILKLEIFGLILKEDTIVS